MKSLGKVLYIECNDCQLTHVDVVIDYGNKNTIRNLILMPNMSILSEIYFSHFYFSMVRISGTESSLLISLIRELKNKQLIKDK